MKKNPKPSSIQVPRLLSGPWARGGGGVLTPYVGRYVPRQKWKNGAPERAREIEREKCGAPERARELEREKCGAPERARELERKNAGLRNGL